LTLNTTTTMVSHMRKYASKAAHKLDKQRYKTKYTAYRQQNIVCATDFYFSRPISVLIKTSTNVVMYNLSTIVDRSADGRCCICTGQTLCVHLPDGSTFLCEITLWSPS